MYIIVYTHIHKYTRDFSLSDVGTSLTLADKCDPRLPHYMCSFDISG